MRFALLLIAVVLLAGCGPGPRESVVLYTSQDQFYAEPILREFTRRTGIEVRPVFDTESAKTAGLANRLRQEAAHPQCDVFWSNEELHTRMLAAEGVFPPERIRAAGYRTRRIAINTNAVTGGAAPANLFSLTNAFWKGRVALAYPLYGTTRAHFLALRQHWGNALWERWCEGLAANGARVVDGNSVVVRLTGAGETWAGLTDSDDIAAGLRQGLPVRALPATEETLVIPNTIAVVRESPGARKLADFLASAVALDELVAAGALEGIAAPEAGLKIDWGSAPRDLEEATETLKRIFLRS